MLLFFLSQFWLHFQLNLISCASQSNLLFNVYLGVCRVSKAEDALLSHFFLHISHPFAVNLPIKPLQNWLLTVIRTVVWWFRFSVGTWRRWATAVLGYSFSSFGTFWSFFNIPGLNLLSFLIWILVAFRLIWTRIAFFSFFSLFIHISVSFFKTFLSFHKLPLKFLKFVNSFLFFPFNLPFLLHFFFKIEHLIIVFFLWRRWVNLCRFWLGGQISLAKLTCLEFVLPQLFELLVPDGLQTRLVAFCLRL